MASFDSNNLMYVTKQYEHEIQDKVKQIYANDETSVIVENVDKQLNAVLEEINSKLSFMDSKVIDANRYRIGVHTQIDETKVDIKSLVDDGLEESSSYPSANAFKSNRLESKFSTYDFINKSLSFDRKGFVNLHGINETGEETVHSFTIKHSLEEYMKIVEFAFTYKQYPTIMNKSSQGLSEESTVTVTRVFRGRFFIIWADPYLEPGKFIVKAIIENADNTGNIIDKRIIDVKRSDSGEDLTVILDDGPQFDLFFTSSGDDVTISIGRLTPYRWLIRKQYSNIYGEEAVNFEVHNSTNANTIHLDEVHYSVNCDSYFIVDKTNNQMGYVPENNNIDSLIKLSNNSAIIYNGETVSRFLFKDVGKYTFVTINNKSYVCISNLGSAILLNKIVDDVFEISTGEILCICGSSILYFNTSSNAISTNNFIDFTPYAGISTVSSVVEHDDRVVVFYINESGKIAYKIREKYSVTGKYQDSNKSYSESELNDFTVNENSSAITLTSIDTPYGIQVVCTETINNNEISSLFNIDDLVISSNIAIFNDIHKLSKYDIHEKQYDNDYTFSVEKIVHTPLFTFMINKTSLGNKLYIIDRERIVDPLSFTEVYDNNNNLLGYSDKSGMIYMKPEENQSEYFIKPNAYLQNVVDVLSTPNGTYIVDEKGVYLLNSDKNLKCMFYTDETDIIGSLLYSNKSKTAGSIIVKETQSGIYNMYRNDYNVKPISNVLVKNEYLDLYSDDYQLYDEDVVEYTDEKPIVKFDSILYVTFVDHGSVSYNTDKTVSIEYSDDKTINDVSKERTASFDRIQSNATSKEYNGVFTPVKMTISPNKYGFKLYKDILKLDTNKVRVSGLNDIKKYVIRHHKGDSVSLQNIENTIIKLLDDQYDRMISENGTITIEQFIIRDKRYWQSMGYEEGTYGARDVLNTCMKYFKHFPRHNNVTLRDYRSTNIFNTPVGRFLKLQDSLFEIGSPNALAEGLYDESFNDDVIGSYENCVTRLRNNYFHVEYINNSKKTIVLGGSSERSYIAVYNCYDPSTDEYSDPFSDPNKIIKLNQKPFNGFSIIDNKIYCWDSTDINSGIYVYNPITNSMEQSTLAESISALNVHVVGVYKVEDLIFISCLKLDSNNNEYYNQIIFNPQTGSITNTNINMLFHVYNNSTNGMLKRFVSRMYKFKECTLLTVIDNGYKNDNIHTETSMYSDYSCSKTGIKFFKYNAITKRFDLIKETSNIIHDVDLFEINGRIFGTCAHDSGYLFYIDADNYKHDSNRLPMKFEYLPKTDSFVQWHCDSVGYGRIHNFFNGVIIGEYPQNGMKNDIECHTIEDNDMRVWKNDSIYKTSLIHGVNEYIIRGNYNNGSFQGIPSVIAKSLKTGLEHTVFNENIASGRYLTGDYYFKAVDTYPLAGKNYYHLNQQHTCFIAMKAVDLNSLHSYNNELLFNTFVRREISNNMIQLNTRIQTAPISSCVYYTKDLYNNFVEHTNLTKFDEGTVYYEHECDYIPLNVYLRSHENLTEQILVSSTNPVYRRAVVGDGFESNRTYYENVHLYDSRDSESVGKDPSLVISVANNEYSLVIQNEDDKIYLQLGTKISISNSLCAIDNFNFVSHWLLDENKSAEYIDTTPNFVDTQYGRFVIGQADVQLYSQDGELLLNQIMSDIDELNSKNVIIHGDNVYLLGYLNSDSTKYIKVYKYDPNGNRFVKHFEILGSSARLIDTEYGVLVCVNKETEFTIYQLTDTGTEHILSKNEKILHQVSIPNTDGNIEVYTFVKTNNADFVKCYKILKNVASEVPVPDELLTGTNMVDYTISVLPKNRAIIFGSFMIWYLDKNIVEPVINTVYKIKYEHNGSEIETINSNVIYEKNGSFKEIVGPNNELSINFVANSSTICGRENGIPSLSLGMGDPLKLGCDYGVNHVELPITNNDQSVVETIDGNDYRLNYNTDSKILFERMDSENTQLPIFGEDGLLYFCNARIDNHTGLPDYENPYRTVDENGHILKDHISFDKVIVHNSKLYGLSKKDKKVYVNRDYTNSNDFIVSFEDTSGNDSLDIDFVKHIGVIYLNSTECWILYNNYEESTESTDDWVRRDTSGSNNIVSEDGKYITKTDYIFAIQKVDRTVILDKDRSVIIDKISEMSHTVYKTTIGLFIISTDVKVIHVYAYNNELQKIYDSPILYTTCRNDATKQLAFNFNILETRNGLIIMPGTNGYLIFEAGIYSSGYEFIPYYDPDFSNINDADLFTLNFVIDKTSVSEGYYKVRKLINTLPVNKFVLRIDRDTYFDGCRIFRLYKTEDGYQCVKLEVTIEDVDIDYEIDKLFFIRKEGGGMYGLVRDEETNSYYSYYNKTRKNTAVYYNGMIYFEYRYGGNIFVMNGSNSIGKEIEKETSDELSVGFELTFVSKNSDVWNGYEQDMNNSLADKLVIKLTGLYNKTAQEESSKLFNLKAFVVDNYESSIDRPYMAITEHNRLINRFPFILNNGSVDLKDLNIKRVLANEEVKNVLKNLINLDEYDETYNITMEIYPAVVSEVDSIEIREELSQNGIDMSDDYYKLRLNRNPSLPYDPFSSLSM